MLSEASKVQSWRLDARCLAAVTEERLGLSALRVASMEDVEMVIEGVAWWALRMISSLGRKEMSKERPGVELSTEAKSARSSSRVRPKRGWVSSMPL